MCLSTGRSTTPPQHVIDAWVFIAQLVDHCSTNTEAIGLNPVEATIFCQLHLQIAYTAITTVTSYNCHDQAVHDLSKQSVHLLSSLADRFSRANTCVKKGKKISYQPKGRVTHWGF